MMKVLKNNSVDFRMDCELTERMLLSLRNGLDLGKLYLNKKLIPP
jgi:hypothetical protein